MNWPQILHTFHIVTLPWLEFSSQRLVEMLKQLSLQQPPEPISLKQKVQCCLHMGQKRSKIRLVWTSQWQRKGFIFRLWFKHFKKHLSKLLVRMLSFIVSKRRSLNCKNSWKKNETMKRDRQRMRTAQRPSMNLKIESGIYKNWSSTITARSYKHQRLQEDKRFVWVLSGRINSQDHSRYKDKKQQHRKKMIYFQKTTEMPWIELIKIENSIFFNK